MDKKHTGLLISTCILSTLTLLLAFSIMFIVYIYNTEIRELNNIISTKNKEISETNGKLKAIKTKLDKYESNNTYDELDDFSRTLLHIIEYRKTQDNRETYGSFYELYACIVTPEGEKYHMIDCPHLSNMTKYKIMNISAAESCGYEKCSYCFD